MAEPNELARRIAIGDIGAIEKVYRIYFHRLRYYGIQVLGQQYQQEVEDVIQDFFMWMAQNYIKMGRVRDFEVYMFQSIRRNLQSRKRTDQDSQKSFERYVNRTLPLRETENHSPEQLYIDKEEKYKCITRIKTELNKLPPYQREILYLRYFEDKSYKEIANILSINDQVAYNYVSRAIKRLKKQMANLSFLLLGLLGGI